MIRLDATALRVAQLWLWAPESPGPRVPLPAPLAFEQRQGAPLASDPLRLHCVPCLFPPGVYWGTLLFLPSLPVKRRSAVSLHKVSL